MKVPNSKEEAAEQALSYVMLSSGSRATDHLPKLTIIGEPPAWVFDLFNEAENEKGILDHRRQLMVRDALKTISRGQNAKYLKADTDMKKLRSWRNSLPHRVDYMRQVEARSSRKHLQSAQLIERREVYEQVNDTIKENISLV